MQIQWGTKELCKGTRDSAHDQLRLGLVGSSQIQPRVRADNVSTYNRKNWVVTIGFIVNVEYSPPPQNIVGHAELQMVIMAEALKDIGKADLKVVFTDNSGTRYFRNAVLTSYGASHRGVNVTYSYEFTAEKIEA